MMSAMDDQAITEAELATCGPSIRVIATRQPSPMWCVVWDFLL